MQRNYPTGCKPRERIYTDIRFSAIQTGSYPSEPWLVPMVPSGTPRRAVAPRCPTPICSLFVLRLVRKKVLPTSPRSERHWHRTPELRRDRPSLIARSGSVGIYADAQSSVIHASEPSSVSAPYGSRRPTGRSSGRKNRCVSWCATLVPSTFP